MGKLIFSVLVFVVISGIASAQNTSPYPWGPDFQKKGKLLGTTTCDVGSTQFKSYDGPTVEKTEAGFKYKTKLYTGMTISVKGKVLYYIFSPNPNSMSPITFSFRRSNDGKLIEISQENRDNNLKKETPNLFALFEEKKNDCKTERIE